MEKMNGKAWAVLSLTVSLLMISIPMFAHHGTGISYDDTKPLVFTNAVITEFLWANPHSIVFFDVKDDQGNVIEQWTAEGNSPYSWGRDGYTRNTIKPGDEVTIHLIRSRGGLNVGLLEKVVLPSGEEVLEQ